MYSAKTVCIIMGIIIGLFTIPLYRWLLGEFAVLVAFPIGLVIAQILYRHSAFGDSGGSDRTRRRTRQFIRRDRAAGRIYVDKYGHIYDPEDLDR